LSKIIRPTKEPVMTDEQTPALDLETERSLDTQCLVLELAGQTWHVPFDTLPAIPRVGEKIRLADGRTGHVTEVEYEFAPEAAPVALARALPATASYARPLRIILRVS
jgi:hypothetical protein